MRRGARVSPKNAPRAPLTALLALLTLLTLAAATGVVVAAALSARGDVVVDDDADVDDGVVVLGLAGAGCGGIAMYCVITVARGDNMPCATIKTAHTHHVHTYTANRSSLHVR
jgi:hypothetical protein